MAPAATALGVGAFIERVEPTQGRLGLWIEQFDKAQIPARIGDGQRLEGTIAVWDLKADTFQAERAVAAALPANDLLTKGPL